MCGMLQPRGDLDLALESLGRHRRGRIGRQNLHDDLPSKSSLRRHEDVRHSSATELTVERDDGPECTLKLVAEVGSGARQRWAGSGGRSAR